jgi:soluble lytic murein transglycosylase
LLRRSDRATGDSLLRSVARSPGYDFYRVAARETLRLAIPPTVFPEAGAELVECATFDLGRWLVSIGATDDALRIARRWLIRDPGGRCAAPNDSGGAMAALAASRVAFAAGRAPSGIQFARLAAERATGLADSLKWAIAPWVYPPWYSSLYRALPESSDASPLDRSLLRAVAWQESKFDPGARSRSNALGLYQLKLSTAADVARRRHERPPRERDLLVPAISLRFGAAYLGTLCERFDRRVIVAVAAYNAGPGRIAATWRTTLERGGDALAAELLGVAETHDYVKKVWAARQAYRDLQPFTGPER